VYVDAEVSFALDVGFKVCHLEMVVHPVDHEVREPRGLSRRLEQLVKQLQALLPEMVPVDFETHQG